MVFVSRYIDPFLLRLYEQLWENQYMRPLPPRRPTPPPSPPRDDIDWSLLFVREDHCIQLQRQERNRLILQRINYIKERRRKRRIVE